MLLYVLLAATALLAYRAGVLVYLRRLAYGKGAAAAPTRFRFWAEHPLSPAKAEARLYWAEATRAADAAAALDVLRPLMEAPGRKAVPALLLAAHWALKDQWLEHAERHCNEAIRRLGRKKDRLLRARVERLRADTALRAQDPRRAAAALAKAVEDNPYDAETRMLRALLVFHLGEAAVAAADYDFIGKHFGNRALRVQAALGGSYVDVWRGELESALRRFDDLLTASAAEPQLLGRKIAVRALFGDAARARAELDASPLDDNQRAYPLACIAAAEGDWDAARRGLAAHLFQGQITDVRAAEAMWVLSGVLREADQEAQSLEIQARLRTLWPESPYLQRAWKPQRVH